MSSLGTAEPLRHERVVGHGHDAYEALRARVAALAGAAHPGLDLPSRVTMLPGEAVAVAEHGHEALALREVLDSRGSLTAGECVWVGMAVAEALAALHRVGLAHGAVSASAVRLPAGNVLLSQLVDGSAEATAADDVAALGRMLESCANGQDAERVRAWTEPMTHEDASMRPTAAMVARALGSCAPAEPLQIAPRGVASSVRASLAPPEGVRRLAEARTWRWRRDARAWTVRFGPAAVAVAVIAIALWALVGWWAGRDESFALAASPMPGHEDPLWVARQATWARFDGLTSGEPEGLVNWTASDSPARAEAESTAQGVRSGRMEVEGLVATIAQLSELPLAPRQPDAVVVRVVYSLSDHVVTLDGQATPFDGYTQTVDLELVHGNDGWTVYSAADVAPGA